jgi:hypothetical protein
MGTREGINDGKSKKKTDKISDKGGPNESSLKEWAIQVFYKLILSRGEKSKLALFKL